MKKYQVDIHYRSLSGNPCFRRFKIKALDESKAFELAHAKVKKLKNYFVGDWGDCVEIKNKVK